MFPVLIALGLLLSVAGITIVPQSAFLGARRLVLRCCSGSMGPIRLAAKRDGMGRGDFKMAALIGCWVGFPNIALALMCGFYDWYRARHPGDPVARTAPGTHRFPLGRF